MQALLSPGDGGDLGWKRLLHLALSEAEVRTMPVVPCRFDEHATQVGVAGLGDLAAPALGAAGVLGRNEASVAHDLASMLEAAERAELGGECDGSDLGDTAQGLEGIDDGFEVRRGGLNSSVDAAFEALDSLRLVVDLHDVVEQDGVLLGVHHLQSTHPLPPRCGPRAALFGGPLSVTKKVLGQAMPCAELVLLGGLASSDEIAKRLMLSIGDPNWAEVAGTVGASELLGVTPIGLDAIARHLGHERRSDDIAMNADAGELPVQDVASGAGFVADAEGAGITELGNELADRFRAIGDGAEGTRG